MNTTLDLLWAVADSAKALLNHEKEFPADSPVHAADRSELHAKLRELEGLRRTINTGNGEAEIPGGSKVVDVE